MVYNEGVLFLAGFEARYSEVSAVNHSTVIFIDNVIRESVTKWNGRAPFQSKVWQKQLEAGVKEMEW